MIKYNAKKKFKDDDKFPNEYILSRTFTWIPRQKFVEWNKWHEKNPWPDHEHEWNAWYDQRKLLIKEQFGEYSYNEPYRQTIKTLNDWTQTYDMAEMERNERIRNYLLDQVNVIQYVIPNGKTDLSVNIEQFMQQ